MNRNGSVTIVILFVVIVLAVAGGIFYFHYVYLPAHTLPRGQSVPTTASAPSQPSPTAAGFSCADILHGADVRSILGIDPSALTVGEIQGNGEILHCNEDSNNPTLWFSFAILPGSHYAFDRKADFAVAAGTASVSGIGSDALVLGTTGEISALSSNQKYEIIVNVPIGNGVPDSQKSTVTQELAKAIDSNLNSY